MKNLSLKLRIPKSDLYLYYNGKRAINEKNLNKILELSKINLKEETIIEKLPNNYRQILGGIRVVEIKKANGTLEKQLAIARKNIKYGDQEGAWHKMMKEKRPEEYYNMQYEKFKKIGGYKFTTLKGERVRNILEKEVADFLAKKGIQYKYEPYINIKNKAFFPDFLVNDNIIIECTMWRGYDKAVKLKNKIKALENKYKIYVLIPEKLHKYYKSIDKNLIFDLNKTKTIFK